MSLPIMTSADDVDGILRYLKTKATGATLGEIEAALGPKLLDSRKLSAYEAWGFATRDGDRLKLTPSGWALSRASSDTKQTLYADVIRQTRPYRLAVEWIFHQGFDQVTNIDVAAHWAQHCADDATAANEKTIRYQAVCFFNVAQAAGLGTYVIGRHGQATRLEVCRDAFGRFIGETGFEPSPDEDLHEDPEPDVHEEIMLNGAGQQTMQAGRSSPIPEAGDVRVFITHGKNMEIVDQVKTMLDLADMDYEVAVDEETTAIPVPDKVLSAMRKCTAGIMCVTADEQAKKEDGTYSINENVLIEIGAAFVLYDKRVVLVWDRRVPCPSNLQGLYRCEFEGDDLSWSAGMRLMKAVNKFKRTERIDAS